MNAKKLQWGGILAKEWGVNVSSIFHLAFPVYNIEEARDFYVKKLGLKEGRVSEHALILTLAGHQIVAHKTTERTPAQKGIYPRHFGLIFDSLTEWKSWLEHCKKCGVLFHQEDRLRHAGEFSEHHTFFLVDPSDNLVEFKHYTHKAAISEPRPGAQVGDKV